MLKAPTERQNRSELNEALYYFSSFEFSLVALDAPSDSENC